MSNVVARRYAKGLLQAVLQVNEPGQSPDDVAAEVDVLARTIGRFNGLELLLRNPAIAPAKKAAVLADVAESLGAGKVTRRLVGVLADKERLQQIPAVAEAYRKLVDEHSGVIDAEVTTPQQLDPAAVEELRNKLARATGREVRLSTHTDADLLGGLVTRIGDVIYDGSLRHQLAKIRNNMARA